MLNKPNDTVLRCQANSGLHGEAFHVGFAIAIAKFL